MHALAHPITARAGARRPPLAASASAAEGAAMRGGRARPQQQRAAVTMVVGAIATPMTPTTTRARISIARRRTIAVAATNNDDQNNNNNHNKNVVDGPAAYANLFNARLFADRERQAEFERCMTDLRQLSMMASKFPEFDVQGKRFFLQAMSEGSERYRIFIKRLELAKATDKAAADYLEYTSQQMAAGGFSIGAMFEGLTQSLARYREIADAEERAEAAGPAEAQRFREALRAEWGQSALGAIDMGQLAQIVSPEVIAKAQASPDFYKAIKDISESPTPDVLARWISHETIGPLVTAMSKLLLQKRGLGGVGGGGG